MDKKDIGKTLALLVMATMVFAIFSGCIGEEKPAETTAAPTTEKPAGPAEVKNPDTIVRYTIGDARNLDPADAYDTASSEVLFQVYETLVTVKGSDAVTIEPLLATDWSVSEDGLVWTFHLRKGVKFSNGNDFTADDVVYSFDRVITMNSPESGCAWILSQFLRVGDTVKVDDYTVELHLEKSFGITLPCLVTAVASIVDSDYVEAHGGVQADTENEFMKENPMGTGPYMLESWTRKQEIRLVKNPNYWGGWEGKHVSNVIIKIVEEPSTRILALKNGDADFADIPTANIEDVKDAPGVRMELGPSPNVTMLHIQTKSENTFMADPAVRKALCYCFDYEATIKDIYNGYAIPLPGPIPKGFPCYESQYEYRYSLDLDKAEEILDAAGFTKNEDGYRFDGKPIRIYYNAGNEERAKMSMMLQGNLAKIGVISQVMADSWPSLLGRMFGTTDWDVMYCGWAPDYIDPDNYIFSFCASADIGGDIYNTGWANERVDELLTNAKFESDLTKRCEMYREAWEIIIDDPAHIWACQPQHVHFEREWVHGYEYNPCILWRYYDYYKE
ncbi:ABC transporter substrate-binding protein [Thermococci archaeon]|nr:MAG: ABC transporter substrate-binding protein [Thermococci archaeon]